MFTAIERELPFIFSNYGMVGMSTPVTPAGTLAILNAELLAGLVFSQLVKAGPASSSALRIASVPAGVTGVDMPTMP